jgi:hypothetical protein
MNSKNIKSLMYIYSVKVQGHPYPWARLVYQIIKLYAEVYTFTVSHDFQMHGVASPKTPKII